MSKDPPIEREPDERPVAADHAATYDPTTDTCMNIMCSRCLAVRRRRCEQGDD